MRGCVNACAGAWVGGCVGGCVDVWVCGKGKYHSLLVGVHMNAASVKIIVESPHEARNGTTT